LVIFLKQKSLSEIRKALSLLFSPIHKRAFLQPTDVVVVDVEVVVANVKFIIICKSLTKV